MALDSEHRQLLDFVESQDLTLTTTVDALVILINSKKVECEKKQWVLFTNSKGDKVLLRDVLGAICDRVQSFQKIGDAAVEYVVHAEIPWAIIKTLLQV